MERVVIIDNGTSSCKGGISGETAPKAVVETVIGRPKPDLGYVPIKNIYIGSDATARPKLLDMSFPIQNGVIQNWDDMDLIWTSLFEELKKDPSQQPLVLTDSPLNTNSNRVKMTQLMFEKYKVPSLHITSHSPLALYASGRTTGNVVDVGDGACNSVCIYEGQILKNTAQQWNIGGKDLTNYLTKLLKNRGYELEDGSYAMQDMKEKTCFVAEDYDKEKANNHTKVKYELPDGQVIELGYERFQCPEALFNTALIREESGGISKSIYESVLAADKYNSKDFYSNIVLVGGSSMFPGIDVRMKWEVQMLAPQNFSVKVYATNDRKFATWKGGSIMASLHSFKSMLFTKEDYAEKGLSGAKYL